MGAFSLVAIKNEPLAADDHGLGVRLAGNQNGVILYDANGNQIVVLDGQVVTPDQPGIIAAGVDPGGGAQFLRTDTDGRLLISSTSVVEIGEADQGDPNTLANAWPVKMTDGSVVLGTPTDPLVVSKVKASTSSVTTATVGTTSSTVLVANTARLGATIHNDSGKNVWIKLGSDASQTSFTVRMGAQDYYEIPFDYTGLITGVDATGTADLRVTELTA